MKMVDVGRKIEGCTAEVPGKKDNKFYYETLRINKNIPGLEDKEIGDVCRLEVEVKITGRSMREDGESKTEDTTLDVLKVGYIGEGGKKTKEEYLKMSDKDREEYDKKSINLDDAGDGEDDDE